MNFPRSLTVVILTLLLSVGASHAQETLKQGDTISGKLRLVKTRHPNGTPLTAYQIVVDKPKALAVKDDFCDGPPKTFHLVVTDDKPKEALLKQRLGKKVDVVLESFFCSETAWHIGDAVSFQWRLAEPVKP